MVQTPNARTAHGAGNKTPLAVALEVLSVRPSRFPALDIIRALLRRGADIDSICGSDSAETRMWRIERLRPEVRQEQNWLECRDMFECLRALGSWKAVARRPHVKMLVLRALVVRDRRRRGRDSTPARDAARRGALARAGLLARDDELPRRCCYVTNVTVPCFGRPRPPSRGRDDGEGGESQGRSPLLRWGGRADPLDPLLRAPSSRVLVPTAFQPGTNSRDDSDTRSSSNTSHDPSSLFTQPM